MIDTKFLDLSNKVANHPPVRARPDGQAASERVAAAARHVGFALIAVGLAEWGAETGGHAQMQARVANQQFDTLSLAPISYAASSAVSCLDLCAAAAYRLCEGAPKRLEFDLNSLAGATQRDTNPVMLPTNMKAWVEDALSDPGYTEMKDVRNRMVHRDIPSASVVGSVPGRTTYPIGGVQLAPEVAALKFAKIAQHRYEKFVAAVLADIE